jgi:hypothetical protein
MPLLRLNRINKGGEILINSDHIVFIEIESKSTTVHMCDRLLFSVEESPASIAAMVEGAHIARGAHAIRQSGLAAMLHDSAQPRMDADKAH